MMYCREMCFFSLQTPPFSNYLKANRDGRKNTKSDILLRKIDFYIFNLEPNLLKHSGASQMEVCLQGSLGSDASSLHHSQRLLGN